MRLLVNKLGKILLVHNLLYRNLFYFFFGKQAFFFFYLKSLAFELCSDIVGITSLDVENFKYKIYTALLEKQRESELASEQPAIFCINK